MAKNESGYPLTNIMILRGTYYDLTKFDYATFGLTCLDIESDEFEAFVDENFKENEGGSRHKENFNELLTTKHHSVDEHFYAFVPTNIAASKTEGQIVWAYKALLLLFPSSLQPHTFFNYQIIDDDKLFEISQVTVHTRNYEGYVNNLLISIDQNIDAVNIALKTINERIKEIKYSNTALGFYMASYHANESYLEYVNLVISLEIIVEGKEQLTYRLKRNLAVLCGMSELGSKNIYANVDKIYNLRSKIVHEGQVDYGKISQYLPYLRALVSRMIIEVLNHNIKSLRDLNEAINRTGFGDKEHISAGFQELIPNITTYTLVSTEVL